MANVQEGCSVSRQKDLDSVRIREGSDAPFHHFEQNRYPIVNVRETSRAIVILLVEDNPGDVRLIIEAFRDYNRPVKLCVVENGAEALAFLLREGKHVDAPRPDLILLDLNLPKKNGREVLTEIKTDDHLKRIPVVVLTASQAKEDIFKAYDLSANSYVTKPFDFNQFIKVLRTIQDFWLRAVKLPEE